MDKKTYYVSVQSGSINEEQGATSYEFVIRATEEETGQLQELFDERGKADNETFMRAYVPGIPYHFDGENDMYDETIKQIYTLIHKLGNHETKTHIEAMNIVQ